MIYTQWVRKSTNGNSMGNVSFKKWETVIVVQNEAQEEDQKMTLKSIRRTEMKFQMTTKLKESTDSVRW